MYKQKGNKRAIGAVIAGAVSLLILVAAGWLLLNRQYVADLANVWAYQPNASIRTIDERVDFTGKGQFYFYATHPSVAPASDFNQDCPRQEPNSPILGCYNAGRIYIYDITNEQLDGIEEVTAAHEMLHAAWERTSETEKERLSILLEEAYTQNADAQLVERMSYYQRSEPGEIINELHSILPTETKNLSPALETYYKQFFEDRQQVVALHEKYSAVFNGLVSQADALYEELALLSVSIDQQSAEYDTAVAILSNDITTFNTRAADGSFGTTAQFNRERNTLLSRSNQLEALRTAIGDQIALYNSKYDQYTLIAGEIEALNESIDSISQLKEAPTLE